VPGGPVEQMFTIVIPGYEGSGRPHRADPFGGTAPGFFEYLVSERGPRPASVTCGLRLGDIEATRSLLTVRGGKFGKDRLVPHGPQIGALVTAQAGRLRDSDSAAGPGSPLFTFDGRRSIHPDTASQAFHHLVPALALPVPEGVSPPRLHDLRHYADGWVMRPAVTFPLAGAAELVLQSA
jgi:integrase